jgi:hypothetical protein
LLEKAIMSTGSAGTHGSSLHCACK